MANRRRAIRHPHRGRLTHAQQMVFRFGYDEKWDAAFVDQADYEATWALHRDRILSNYRHGRRPQAWWILEAPFAYPGYDEERQTLFAAGLLEPAEREEVVGEWRQDFESGHRWTDVPSSLWGEWEAQRRAAPAAEQPVSAAERPVMSTPARGGSMSGSRVAGAAAPAGYSSRGQNSSAPKLSSRSCSWPQF
jgi:hypothetical protein